MTDKVRFKCDWCKVNGEIQAEPNESVYAVCERIRTEHNKNSPYCPGDLSTIKLLDAQERNEVTSHAQP